MDDNQILQNIVESKTKQNLRDALNDSKEFIPETQMDSKVLEEYEQMTEEQKQAFSSKGWKND